MVIIIIWYLLEKIMFYSNTSGRLFNQTGNVLGVCHVLPTDAIGELF